MENRNLVGDIFALVMMGMMLLVMYGLKAEWIGARTSSEAVAGVWGRVCQGERSIAKETRVEALVDGVPVATTTTTGEGGQWFVLELRGQEGGVVTFRVDGKEVLQTARIEDGLTEQISLEPVADYICQANI